MWLYLLISQSTKNKSDPYLSIHSFRSCCNVSGRTQSRVCQGPISMFTFKVVRYFHNYYLLCASVTLGYILCNCCNLTVDISGRKKIAIAHGDPLSSFAIELFLEPPTPVIFSEDSLNLNYHYNRAYTNS